MLRFLKGRVTERKLRLFAVACCRYIGDLLRDARGRAAVEMSERYADGLADRQALRTAREAAEAAVAEGFAAVFSGDGTAWPGGPEREAAAEAAAEPLRAFRVAAEASSARVWAVVGVFEEMQAAKAREKSFQCDLLRDLFGNPFRPVTVTPCWQTPDVVTLAGHIYHDRAFERLPELAGALEAAGCTDEAVLAHCRGPGPHVRGCWVADVLLGKE
jgi:hypothetical protein